MGWHSGIGRYVDELGDMSGRRVEVESTGVLVDDFFRLEEAVVRFERFDGTMSAPVRRLSLERGDSAAVLLLDRDTRQVLLVEQFKYPTYGKGDGWMVETVAGMVDDHEKAEATARREVHEETGYDLLTLEHVATFYVSPGGTSERVVLFYGEVSQASRTGAGGGVAGEGEDIRLRRYTLQEASAAVDDGTIADAKTIIGLQWLEARLGRAEA